jgi:hypothetical protein
MDEQIEQMRKDKIKRAESMFNTWKQRAMEGSLMHSLLYPRSNLACQCVDDMASISDCEQRLDLFLKTPQIVETLYSSLYQRNTSRDELEVLTKNMARKNPFHSFARSLTLAFDGNKNDTKKFLREVNLKRGEPVSGEMKLSSKDVNPDAVDLVREEKDSHFDVEGTIRKGFLTHFTPTARAAARGSRASCLQRLRETAMCGVAFVKNYEHCWLVQAFNHGGDKHKKNQSLDPSGEALQGGLFPKDC